ncbi:MAG: hypothetical protein R3249_08180 [Nitriliruptorales bacterium]|nr:hypothetical protein [Nitriliruptorales bacterium]
MDDSKQLATEHQRIRRAARIVVGGLAVGVVVAIVSALRGGSGRAGLVLVLLLTALGCVVGAADGAVLMLVDQYRGRTSTWRRLVLVVVLGFSAAVLVAMVAGVAEPS